MKKILLGSLLLGNFIFGQEQDQKLDKTLQLKGNLLTLPVGMLNVGVEKQLSEHYTVQADVFVSPWKSFAGKHAQVYLLGFDGRYYFDKAFKRFYVGANLSGGYYNIQKWNYWHDDFYTHKDGEITPYIESNLYQEGFTFVIGAVGGYQFQWNDHWGLDIYLGIGNMQSFYKGYDKLSGDRYDDGGDSMGHVWNRSGEWLPYRGGVMLTYKL
ncbi:DUF3575 domain-containing protein [Soonwooa sp.]|uniref:DUF3575 domain-containing protein n=1 Tax=Soonwooa sp. TaxID=1938592 RepID=UPI0026194F8A|nr:DUF3575 domain-containing protein [Soonwooa sp.]